MGSAGNDRRSRPSRSRRPGAGQAERRRNGKSPLPSPGRIRWYRTRVVGEGSGRLSSWTPVAALTRAGGGRQTIANDVPRGRPGRDVVEAAVRQALSELDGRWKARIAPVDAYCVEIVALHAEMDDLRRRRQALLRRLPAASSRAYQSLADAGRVPAIAAVAKGACGGCESPLPEFVVDALSHGAVAVCAPCERLLRPSEGGE